MLEEFLQGRCSPSEFAAYAYDHLGVESVASRFALVESCQRWQANWTALMRESDTRVVRGAFLLSTECLEKTEMVSVPYAESIIHTMIGAGRVDEWILSYVMNRFFDRASRWETMLKEADLWTGALENTWGAVGRAARVFRRFLEHDVPLEQLDEVMSCVPFDRVFDVTRRAKGCAQELGADWTFHGLDRFLQETHWHDQSKLLATQLFMTESAQEARGRHEIARLFVRASAQTPLPLGAFLAESARKMTSQSLRSDFHQAWIPRLSLAARGDGRNLPTLPQKIQDALARAFAVRAGRLIRDYERVAPKMAASELVRTFRKETGRELQGVEAAFDFLGVNRIRMQLPNELQGLCLKVSNLGRGIIVVSDHLTGGRRQFVLAHELGHFLLHDFGTHTFLEETDADLAVAAYRANNQLSYSKAWESEANEFAQWFLIPQGSKIQRRLQRAESPFIPLLSELSQKTGLSLSVLASRLVRETGYAMYLVLSRGGDVAFRNKSGEWTESRDVEYNAGIPSDGVSAELVYSKRFDARGPSRIAAEEWCDEWKERELYEEAFSTGYGDVYTFLYDRY